MLRPIPKRITRRRVGVIVVGIGLALALGTAVSASGAITVREIGSFTLADEVGYPAGHTFTVSIVNGSLLDTATVRTPPGGSFGWHSHNAAVVVTVTAGTLALYDTDCNRQAVAAGHGFVEEAGAIHLARNEGSTLVVLTATYLGVPAGQPEDEFEPADFDPCNRLN